MQNSNKTFVFLFIGALIAFVYIFMVSFLTVPIANEKSVYTILGFMLGTVLTGAFNYFTGTTVGSQNKDKTIADLQNTVQQAIAATPPQPAAPAAPATPVPAQPVAPAAGPQPAQGD